jgi:flagellin
MVRMKALSIQSGSGQLGADERAMLDTEFQALLAEVDRIANDTDFAGTSLVSGSSVIAGATNHIAAGVANITYRGDFSAAATGTLDFTAATGVFDLVHNGITYSGTLSGGPGAITAPEVVTLSEATTSNKIDIALSAAFVTSGDLSDAAVTNATTSSGVSSFTFKVGTGVSVDADTISIDVNSIAANALGIDGTDILTAANADLASVQISTAINSLQTARAVVGANQNRLDFAAANIATASENTESARSQLLDLDVAQEMTTFTSKQILVQAGVSMLTQANQMPQNLLQLFR